MQSHANLKHTTPEKWSLALQLMLPTDFQTQELSVGQVTLKSLSPATRVHTFKQNLQLFSYNINTTFWYSFSKWWPVLYLFFFFYESKRNAECFVIITGFLFLLSFIFVTSIRTKVSWEEEPPWENGLFIYKIYSSSPSHGDPCVPPKPSSLLTLSGSEDCSMILIFT